MSSRTRRWSVWMRQDRRCYYCAAFIRLPMPGELVDSGSREVATVEHIQPRALGGRSDWASGNCVIACGWCNNGWGALIDQWALNIFGRDA